MTILSVYALAAPLLVLAIGAAVVYWSDHPSPLYALRRRFHSGGK